MIIDIDGVDVELLRKRIKNINLRINAQGQVKVSAPIKCSLDLIRCYLQDKRHWIHTHRARLLVHTQTATPTLQFRSGEFLAYLGQLYELAISEGSKLNISIDGRVLHCIFPFDTPFLKRKHLIQNWYRQQMNTLIPSLIEKWEPMIGVSVVCWGVKAMKTRWGSCNTQARRIWLSLNLIQKPLVCLEYVLVHEMVHLLEASHNRRFHALMSQFMPNWKLYKKQLEQNVTLNQTDAFQVL